MSINRIDDRWLPALASRAQALAAFVRSWRQRAAGESSAIGGAIRHEPALAATVVAVALAGLLIAIVGVHDPTDGGSDTASVQQFGSPAPPNLLTTLGPVPGTSVPSYLTSASFDLRHFAEIARGRSTYAVVDLRSYLTPAEAAATFAGVNVVRAYVRVPSKTLPTDTYPIPLQSTFGKLALGMESDAKLAASTAVTYHQLVNGLIAKSPQDKTLRQKYARQAAASQFEAGRLSRPGTCACVFAVVVREGVAGLERLAARRPIRAVDPAPPTATLDQITVLPLRPDVTTIVPKPGLFGV
jgi:hypothetical protein